MNYLGLDYGLKHLGIAMAIGPLAEPVASVSTAKALHLIKEIADKNNISEIIIGQPDQTLKVEFEKFINSLKITNLKLIICDETLSSHDARQALLHTTQSKRKKIEHSVSAAIILQSYLDSYPTTI